MAMSWAVRRQLFFLGITLIFLMLLGMWVGMSYFNKPPTCFDGKQNGEETGIDCGGMCARACLAEVDDIKILWSRAFEVLPGRFNAVAYLESKNEDAAVRRIGYRFRFADSNNIYIGKREGSTFIPPSGKFAIFESAIDLGNSEPVYTNFEFTEVPVWEKVSLDKVRQLEVSVSDIELINQETSPRLSATIRNRSLFQISNLFAIAILYDNLGNAISASRTYLDALPGESGALVSFTWPEAFDSPVLVKEIIPMYDIFAVELK